MGDQEKQGGKNKPPYIDESLVINSRLSEIERQQRGEKAEQRKHEGSQRKTNRLIAAFTGLLFVTSLVSDVVLIWQSTVAKESANAAQSAAETATSTLHLDQRAWLSSKITTPVFSEGKPLLVINAFINTGKTPALHVKTCQVLEAVESSRNDVDLSCPKSAEAPGLSIIMPGQNLERLNNAAGDNPKTPNPSTDGLLRDPLMSELRRATKTLYLYGRVDYQDIFGNPHWVTFCSTMLMRPPIEGGQPVPVAWGNCQNYNDIDK